MHAVAILERMLPALLEHSDSLRVLRLDQPVQCEARIALYLSSGERPPLFLSEATVKSLGALSASFDVDLYVLDP